MEQLSQRYSAPFVVVAAVFATALVVSNIIAVKIAGFDVNIAGQEGLFISVSFVLFPISYIFGDILTEVYGYAAARRVIWLGFACNVLAVIAIWLGQILPSAPFWENQAAYETILGATPRLLVASFIAYLFGEFLNSFVLAKLKIATAGRWLWLRTITSTVVGQGVDSAVFYTLAFAMLPVIGGVMSGGDLVVTFVTAWIFKSVYEAAATPLTYAAVSYLKRLEGVDTYDRDTNFNPLSV